MRQGRHFTASKSWEPELEELSVKFPPVSKFWRPPPHDLRMEWSSILSPDRKWSSPTPENERVGFTAWQWLLHFHREGVSADVRPNWSLLASLLPRGTVIRDTSGDDIPRFRPDPIWLSSVETLSFAVAARKGKTSTSPNVTCHPRFVFRVASLTST